MPPAGPDASWLDELDALLERGEAEGGLQAALELVLERTGFTLGTVHMADPATGLLVLRAHRAIPEGVLERVRTVPVGKGMAGLAAARREPVQVCNLQTDASGVARPGARETGSQGSIAVPMLVDEPGAAGPPGPAVRGVLGVGKASPHEFTPAETALLLEAAARIGRRAARAP